MSEKPYNRPSLKDLFSDGNRPNAENFGSLIDSMVNKIDDGISKTPDEGLILSPEGEESHKVLSFKDKIQDYLPKWSFDLKNGANSGLEIVQHISSEESKTSLFFNKEGNIGVNTTEPKTSFDVNGIAGMHSRMGTGTDMLGTISADRKWHDITPTLKGCNALEVVAQVGKEGTGRHALLHAYALSTFGNSRGRIRKTQSSYDWRWWNRLTLRWVGTTYSYKLQMRTRSSFGSDTMVKYHITKLWDTDIMQRIK